jgi:hypothetical protein
LSLQCTSAASDTICRRPTPISARLLNIAHLRFCTFAAVGEREGKRSARCNRLP